MVKKLSQLYLDTRRALMAVEQAQQAGVLARYLVCHVTGKSQEAVLADGEMYVSEETCQKVEALTARVLSGEPIAYVLGAWEFYGLPLYVDKRVLIPRDDTCAVTALAVKKAIFLEQNPRILDLCTGSGCIGLAIASHVRDARVTLADISVDALAVAKRNIKELHLSGRVTAVQMDVRKEPPAFLGKFDMIVSNPPYVTTGEMEELPPSVRDFEPHLALHGGEDGLDFYRWIVEYDTELLKPGGFLCLEFGMGQGDAVCAMLEARDFQILELSRDYNDRERAVIAAYGRKED